MASFVNFKSQSCFALVDCHNFYVSCERVFRPDLEKRPVVVLSNNDGCIIARSNEAKILGIPMGAPLFSVKDIIRRYNIEVFSSNYALYGDLSRRVMSVIQDSFPDMEIYSIDEAFIDLKSIKPSSRLERLESLVKSLRCKLGIGVGIGYGPTKVLAKLANRHVKKQRSQNSVWGFESEKATETLESLLRNIALEDIWGINYASASKLRTLGITHAWDLHNYDHRILKKRFNVVLARLCLELQGISCLKLEVEHEKYSMTSSRSFGCTIRSDEELMQTLATHLSKLCRKLRLQERLTGLITVFISSSRHSSERYHNSMSIALERRTDDTFYLLSKVRMMLKAIYKPGIEYKKSGILIGDFEHKKGEQQQLLSRKITGFKQEKLLKVIDTVNNKFGPTAIKSASCGVKQRWKMKSTCQSPHYTTRWEDLALVH